MLSKTRFGFDLRATGRSETAAVASGVKVKRMVLLSMVISGGAAGLVGMPLLFGQDYAYGDTVQSGLGFAGIAEPASGAQGPQALASATLIWCSALAASPGGERLGTGGGWYDRALAYADPAATVGVLVSDAEVTDALPAATWDRRVDLVVTPTRTLWCGEPGGERTPE